ncbi:unnamed protein product [Closterium sp. NIES-54]
MSRGRLVPPAPVPPDTAPLARAPPAPGATAPAPPDRAPPTPVPPALAPTAPAPPAPAPPALVPPAPVPPALAAPGSGESPAPAPVPDPTPPSHMRMHGIAWHKACWKNNPSLANSVSDRLAEIPTACVDLCLCTGSSLASSHCMEFSIAEVLKATNDWSKDNQLGSGAFGDVYKGVSPHDGTTLWAVKRAKLIFVDFQKEPAFCHSSSVTHALPLLADREHPLTLKQRLDILIGLARGFEYLHGFGIVHRDIKPANVLITHSMQAKIADFGLVKMEGTSVSTTRVMGTPGYVDPAYFSTCKATTASDVYSFGVLMLVMFTGRPPFVEGDGQDQLASDCLSSGDSGSLKHPTMDAPPDVVLHVAQLALTCTAERTAARPSMAHIANELQSIREEVVGKVELIAAVKVDTQVQEKEFFASVLSLDEQLQILEDN